MDADDSTRLLCGRLDGVQLEQYYGPPGSIDASIAAEIPAVAQAELEQARAFSESLTERHRRILARFALRAPMVALQLQKPDHLDAGLSAHCLITAKVQDWRDDLVFFAPYHFVARTLSYDPVLLFDAAATHAIPDLAELLRTFGRRTDVTLQAFGWRLVAGPSGTTFESIGFGSERGALVGERSWDEVNKAQVDKLMAWIARQSEDNASKSGS